MTILKIPLSPPLCKGEEEKKFSPLAKGSQRGFVLYFELIKLRISLPIDFFSFKE